MVWARTQKNCLSHRDRDGTGDDPPPLYTDVCKPTKGHYDWGGMVLGIATTLVPILLEAIALRESEPYPPRDFRRFSYG